MIHQLPPAARASTKVGDEAWSAYARALGLRLYQLRSDRRLTQEKLAHLAGITRFHYQQLEKGRSQPGTPANPTLRNLIAISQALEVPLTGLLPPGIPDLTDGR
ncbi:MAG: helix-turn-helix domain-containing protein [Micrococcales bacterium]|nr:helix-turn-helix domain-containing protein [Micrococcales bacterium]